MLGFADMRNQESTNQLCLKYKNCLMNYMFHIYFRFYSRTVVLARLLYAYGVGVRVAQVNLRILISILFL